MSLKYRIRKAWSGAATQQAVPADRFARKIVGFLKSSCAARSRRLNGRALGRPQMKTGSLIGSEVGGDCQLGGPCPGRMPRPLKALPSNTDEGFPARQSWLSKASGRSEADGGCAAGQGGADNADERPSIGAVQVNVRRSCLAFGIGKAGGPTRASSRRPCRCAQDRSNFDKRIADLWKQYPGARLKPRPLGRTQLERQFAHWVRCWWRLPSKWPMPGSRVKVAEGCTRKGG
jgi:hypothetical protein